MSDVQQWRRMIQPARVRTPAAIDIEDTENLTTALPATPKISLKPKFSSYFVSHGSSAITTAKVELPTPPLDDISSPRLPTWSNHDVFPTPNAEGMIDSIMCRLMSDPYSALEPRFNGMLLHIFEAFRNANMEKLDLQAQVHQEMARSRALFKRFHEAQKEWADEREDFKAEVKRLEILLSKGKRGVAEVTLARQDSRLRQKEADRRSRADEHGLEVIFDMLEKNKRWSSQRGMTLTPLTVALADKYSYIQSSSDFTISKDETIIKAASCKKFECQPGLGSPSRHTSRSSTKHLSRGLYSRG